VPNNIFQNKTDLAPLETVNLKKLSLAGWVFKNQAIGKNQKTFALKNV
jgi:hypothetical protein